VCVGGGATPRRQTDPGLWHVRLMVWVTHVLAYRTGPPATTGTGTGTGAFKAPAPVPVPVPVCIPAVYGDAWPSGLYLGSRLAVCGQCLQL